MAIRNLLSPSVGAIIRESKIQIICLSRSSRTLHFCTLQSEVVHIIVMGLQLVPGKLTQEPFWFELSTAGDARPEPSDAFAFPRVSIEEAPSSSYR
jgi:hypothetical protein